MSPQDDGLFLRRKLAPPFPFPFLHGAPPCSKQWSDRSHISTEAGHMLTCRLHHGDATYGPRTLSAAKMIRCAKFLIDKRASHESSLPAFPGIPSVHRASWIKSFLKLTI